MKPKTSIQLGFTLIEMVIVIFIVAMISTISIANYRKGEKQRSLTIASDIVINAIRNAQNFSLTSRQIAGTSCANKAPASYIIKFTAAQTMELYGVDKSPCTGTTLIETYTLPPHIRVQTNGYRINGTATANMQVKFTTPYGQLTGSTSSTTNSGAFNSFTTATVTIEYDDGSISKVVTIDGVSGRIGE